MMNRKSFKSVLSIAAGSELRRADKYFLAGLVKRRQISAVLLAARRFEFGTSITPPKYSRVQHGWSKMERFVEIRIPSSVPHAVLLSLWAHLSVSVHLDLQGMYEKTTNILVSFLPKCDPRPPVCHKYHRLAMFLHSVRPLAANFSIGIIKIQSTYCGRTSLPLKSN